jgi:hypothetical protein
VIESLKHEITDLTEVWLIAVTDQRA